MLSAPPAITSWCAPLLTCMAAWSTDWSPEPQRRSTPVRSSRPRRAISPSSAAVRALSEPPYRPIGVLTGSQMTASLIRHTLPFMFCWQARRHLVKPYRSMLFVPGHKPSWAEKAIAAGADAIILDLEDSVPAADKAAARAAVRETIGRLHEQSPRADVWVRPNDYGSGLFGADAEAVMVPGLAGLFLPKVSGAEEIVRIDAVVSHIEAREGLEAGVAGLIASFE